MGGGAREIGWQTDTSPPPVPRSTLAAPMSPPLPRVLTFPRPPAGATAPPAERAGSSATAADTVAQGRPLTWSAGAAGER